MSAWSTMAAVTNFPLATTSLATELAVLALRASLALVRQAAQTSMSALSILTEDVTC